MENQYLSRIEEALASYLPAKDCLQKDVIEAMEYTCWRVESGFVQR